MLNTAKLIYCSLLVRRISMCRVLSAEYQFNCIQRSRLQSFFLLDEVDSKLLSMVRTLVTTQVGVFEQKGASAMVAALTN